MKDFIDFNKLSYALRHGIEIDGFYYKNISYSILAFEAWYFCSNAKGIDYKICEFKEFDYLIEWLSNYKIDGITIKEIFDKGLYDIEKGIGGIPSDYEFFIEDNITLN